MKVDKRKKVVWFTIALTFFLGLSLLIVLNIGFYFYVNEEARVTIDERVKTASALEQQIAEEDKEERYNVRTTSFLGVNYIFSSGIEKDNIYAAFEKEMYQYCIKKDGTIVSGNVYKGGFGEHTVYYALYDNESQEDSEQYVIYVDMTPLYSMLKGMNVLFILILLITISIAIVWGVRTGSKFEDSEEMLRKFFSNASHELKNTPNVN